MTKNHNHKRPIQPNKDFPGCMGGILNLFDFNQAYAGRRLITNKRHADGLEAPRNSLDVSLETPQSSEVKNEDIPYAYEMKKVSTTKKKTAGMPMKALIAQEMSKEMESKRRTPSVVARLMGLDPLPAESTLVHHIKAAEIHPQKNISGKQQQRPKSARDVHFFSMKSKAQASNPRQELPLPKPCERAIDHQDQKASLGTLPFRDHPQEQQLQEFKKEFEAWQASKIQDCPKAVQLDELNLQLVEKQMLVREKLNEAKMALVREKFIDAKRLATEKLQQSKEFLDALEILQSNKELFLKFLQEPNSLFSKHPQDIQSTLQLPSQRKQLPKMKSSSIIKEHEVFKEKDDSHIRRSRNRDLVFAQCHSPSHPLDPCLYEKMEDCYVDNMQCQTDNPDNELSKTVSAFERKAHRSQSERHLIFDCINEVLLDMLGPFSNPHPWVRPTKRNLQPMPAGKQLLEQTWRTICHYLYPQSDSPYTLENLVAKDLARGTWMDMEDDVEMVGVEVEKIIFSDMIEEVLCDLVCRV